MVISQKISPTIYYKDSTSKTHIILHHTAGGNASGALSTWIAYAKMSAANVGAHFIVDRNGEVIQCIPLDKWSNSLGLSNYKFKSKWESQAVTIEIVSAGKLDKNGKTWYNSIIPASDIELLSDTFRGSKYYHAYTDAQLLSLGELLEYISDNTDIQLKTGDMATFFDYQGGNLKKKKPGDFSEKTIWTHVNFRTAAEKQDCYPSVKLIKLLRNYEKKKASLTPSSLPEGSENGAIIGGAIAFVLLGTGLLLLKSYKDKQYLNTQYEYALPYG